MPVTATQLRADIYRILDEILETGVPVEIERGGRKLRIVPVETAGRLAGLEPHPEYVVDDLDTFVHLDWTGEWVP